MRNDHGTNQISGWILRARKLRLMNTLKRFIPQPMRQKAWQLALEQTHHDVLGSRLFIPADARNRSLMLGEYEPAVAARISSLLRPGMTFCDVGANIGVFTLLASKLVGETGRVVAFEPIPENAQVLRTNIEINGRRNVIALEKAVTEQGGRCEIHLSSLCGCHSMVAGPDSSAGKVLSVETVRLDQVDELAHIDLLKVDAEGAEVSVLRSLGTRRPHQIILEYNAERLAAAGYTGAQFLKVLTGLGYAKIEDLDEPARGLAPIEKGELSSTNLCASLR